MLPIRTQLRSCQHLLRKFCSSESRRTPRRIIYRNVTIHLKNTILLLLIFLLFISCQTDNVLNGTWVSSHDYSKEDTTFGMIGIPPQDIMTLKDGDYIWNRYLNNNIRSWKGTFKIKSDTLVFDENQESKFPIFSRSSNELKFDRGGGVIEVYKKVAESLKYRSNRNINLVGETYILKTEDEIIDTLIFRNDSIVEWTSDRDESGSNRWLLTDHNNFKVLFIPWIGQSIIYQVEHGNLQMVIYEKNSAKVELRKIE